MYKIKSTDRIVMAKKEILPLRFPVKQSRYGDFKPKGLWYAIGTEWIDWVRSEMPHWEGDMIYKIELNPSKILYIRNRNELLSFSNQYSVINQDSDIMGSIDWKSVAEKYSGIEISPYQHDLRYNITWYYTWDVASGCIWKEDGIKSINRVKNVDY